MLGLLGRAAVSALLCVGCADAPATELAGGMAHVCALDVGEPPRCWGLDDDGQASGAFGPSLDVGAGGFTSCAVDLEGGVWCAGQDTHGQLGDGALESRATPVRVPGVPPAVEVSVGFAHACARTDAGEVWCWGWSSVGQALPGESSDVAPGRVEGLPAATHVVAGYTHSCAFDAAGDARCWGELTGGLVESFGSARDVAIGVDHLCLAGEQVRCFGAEPGGARPQYPEDGRAFDGEASVAAGGIDHACFASAHGVRCLGKNEDGQLGDGRMGAVAETPVPVAELEGPIDALVVGQSHSCALRDGEVWCWGANDFGQILGDVGTHSLVPTRIAWRASTDR